MFIDALKVLGISMNECGRLAALPYMLRRGGLRRKFGDDACGALAHLAEGTPLAIQPSEAWLNPLVSAPAIDPGEAQLLAASAEHGVMLLTGDKRALHGVREIPGYAEALDGRIVVLEAILAELCTMLGSSSVRSRIQPLMEVDIAVRVCFSGTSTDPLVALRSYYEDLAVNLEPLNLWRPTCQGGA